MSIDRIHPPSPQLLLSHENSVGHRVLGLVKAVEKADAQSHKELSTLLNSLSEIFLRKGLLGLDSDRADKILASEGKTSSLNSGHDKVGGGRKKNGKGGLTLGNDVNPEAGMNSGSATNDVNLLLSALVRLAGGNHELSSPRTDTPLLLTSHANVILGCFQVFNAILQSLLSRRRRRDVVALAEYELIAAVSRTLLTGISRTLTGFVAESEQNVTKHTIMVSAFRVATMTVSLFGMKLSRNQAVLSSLRSLAWNAVAVQDRRLQKAAGSFLAALPLTGVDKMTPSALWTEASMDCIAALFVLFQTVVPLKGKAFSGPQIDKVRQCLSETVKSVISVNMEKMIQDLSVENRVANFNGLTMGLTQCIVSLLEAECLVSLDVPMLSAARFPLVELLDLLEFMITFPSAAENVFYGTKKRLRMEIIEGGFLSSTAIVERTANHIKKNGLIILNTMMQSLSRPVLLPYGKRIMKLAYSSLQSSCSLALRGAVDPMSSLQMDSKRKKWLHSSLDLRTKAIETFDIMLCIIGSNALIAPSSTDSATKRTRASPAQLSVTLVVGCLIEQLLSGDDGNNWGSIGEQVTLLSTTMKTMSSILTQGTGYLSHQSRLQIDSTIQSCLDLYLKRTRSWVFSNAEVKLAFLQLSATCLVTPWPDGATTSLVDDMRTTSSFLASDVDVRVASQARSCLQLMQCLETPRSPPLLIVTRGISTNEATFSNNTHDTMSAGAIVERLEAAQSSIIAHDAVERNRAKDEAKRKSERSNEMQPSGVVSVKRTKSEASAPILEPMVEVRLDPEMPSIEKTEGSTSEGKRSHTVAKTSVMNSTTDTQQDAVLVQSKGEELDVGDDDSDDMMPGIVDAGPDKED